MTEEKAFQSIPFMKYFEEKKGQKVTIDNFLQSVQILDESGQLVAKLRFAKSLKHAVREEELLQRDGKITNAYFVYGGFMLDHDWLWSHDVIDIQELL